MRLCINEAIRRNLLLKIIHEWAFLILSFLDDKGIEFIRRIIKILLMINSFHHYRTLFFFACVGTFILLEEFRWCFKSRPRNVSLRQLAEFRCLLRHHHTLVYPRSTKQINLWPLSPLRSSKNLSLLLTCFPLFLLILLKLLVAWILLFHHVYLHLQLLVFVVSLAFI